MGMIIRQGSQFCQSRFSFRWLIAFHDEILLLNLWWYRFSGNLWIQSESIRDIRNDRKPLWVDFWDSNFTKTTKFESAGIVNIHRCKVIFRHNELRTWMSSEQSARIFRTQMLTPRQPENIALSNSPNAKPTFPKDLLLIRLGIKSGLELGLNLPFGNPSVI